MVNGTTAELYERAKELVPDVDKEIEILKKKGECLTNFEALNHIIQKNSREVVGKQWFDGFWLKYTKSRKGNIMAYIIADHRVRMIFFEKELAKKPKKFAPIKIFVKIIRNIISQTETYEYIKHTKGKLTQADMLGMISPPSTISDKQFYLVAGKIRYVNSVGYDKGQKLSTPKPIFEQNLEGDRLCNLRLAVSDFSNENAMCNVTLRDPEMLATIYGVSYLKMVDYFKKFPDEEKKLEKLKNGLVSRKVLIFGNGSNKHPTEERTIATPYLTPGTTGFVELYDKVFSEAVEELENKMADVENEVDEAEQPKKKIGPKKTKKIIEQVRSMIIKGKASKKSLKAFAEKKKIPKNIISDIVEKEIESGKAELKGTKIISKEKAPRSKTKSKSKTEKKK